jgi:hypothetical protein
LEHSARNTLIQAVRQPGPANEAAPADYRAITSMVRAPPKLAELLRGSLPALTDDESPTVPGRA